MNKNIIIKRAHTNNLCDIDLEIPKHSIVVFSGVSGSGKSSLLFDTIYTEAQRQLIETFGSFARARLPKLSRPDVDEIKNLSTPIVIDQKKMGSNLRSTVGTATELATYIRLLYSRIGQPFLNLPSWCFSFNHPARIARASARKSKSTLTSFWTRASLSGKVQYSTPSTRTIRICSRSLLQWSSLTMTLRSSSGARKS